MKKLILLVFTVFLFSSAFSQIKLRLSTELNSLAKDTVKTNIAGTTLKKGDEFYVYVSADGNKDSVTRHLYFDFEFQNTVYELVSITNTGTGGSGGILPAGSQISESFYQYPGYRFVQSTQNTTSDGNVNYSYANYSYTQGSNHTIIRYDLVWASDKPMPYTGYWGLVKLKFKLKSTAVGFAYDPIRMNFGAAWHKDGSFTSTIMESPLKLTSYIDPVTESYVKGHVETNSAIGSMTLTRVAFIDTAAKSTYLVDANDAGDLAIDQTKFKDSTVYKVAVRLNADVAKEIFNSAVTVSDFTAAQAEFTGQNLDGTYAGSNIKTGMGYYAADVNKSKSFDGGDLTKIFAQSVGMDTLYVLPSTYRPGTDVYIDVPTLTDSLFNNATTSSWKEISSDYTYFTTGKKGTNLPLNIKYVIPGDINRSHSSQVIAADKTIKSYSVISAINTPNTSIPTIDVSLNNLTVLSNSIEIPINISSEGNVSALQFEFTYDSTKIKFEELASTLPNTWFTFATPRAGRIKFGAINKDLKEPITGKVIPFKLKFSSIENGLDLATQIRISPVMDASDNKGNQLGINLNTTSIKLTGYNNF